MRRSLLPDVREETDLARRVRLLAVEQWGERRVINLIGQHESLTCALEKVFRFAQAQAPVLLSGETGTGKELFARAIYLLGSRRRRPFITVNCAQYGDGQLIASELFGHRRGSFTGAVTDHRGVFEDADGGVVFLDEVGELSPTAQAMLLRALSEGEILPVGETRARSVDVRVIAATNRDLGAMVAAGQFRADLYYRLRFLHLQISPLRVRGDDWRLMLDHYVRQMNARADVEKQFSADALERLSFYTWPGNVRELRGLVEMSHSLCSEQSRIELSAFEEQLENGGNEAPRPTSRAAKAEEASPRHASGLLSRMRDGSGTFWTEVYEPFMQRELNRGEVRAVVEEGLRRSNWSYKRAIQVFGVEPGDYLKFMDFLRHHQLKPQR